MLKQYDLASSNCLDKDVKPMQHKYKKNIDSHTAQKIGIRAYNALSKVLFSDGGKLHFKSIANPLRSLEAKTNASGMRFNFEEQSFSWNGLVIPVNIDEDNMYEMEALVLHKVCYCRIIRKFVRGKYKYTLQLILDKPLILFPKIPKVTLNIIKLIVNGIIIVPTAVIANAPANILTLADISVAPKIANDCVPNVNPFQSTSVNESIPFPTTINAAPNTNKPTLIAINPATPASINGPATDNNAPNPIIAAVIVISPTAIIPSVFHSTSAINFIAKANGTNAALIIAIADAPLITSVNPILFDIIDNVKIEPISDTNIPPAIAICLRSPDIEDIAFENNQSEELTIAMATVPLTTSFILIFLDMLPITFMEPNNATNITPDATY